MPLPISHILEGLNESQRKAVTTTEGPVFIVAGPGTGKTLTMVRRIAYLVQSGVPPENIVAVTFTNRAAREMKERAAVLLGGKAGKVFIGTFHLFGLKIIRDTGRDGFIVYDRLEQNDLLNILLKGEDLRNIEKGGRRLRGKTIAEKISRIKNLLEAADDGLKRIYGKYQAALAVNSALDFDDLILEPIEILSSGEILEKYRDTFRYLMVDEYQDINPLQYTLLKLLAGRDGNVCAVGDPDQTIYAFRGSDAGTFPAFMKDFKNAEAIMLTENYRSSGVILNASNHLIRNSITRIDRELKPTREKGIPITIISVPDERAESGIIVGEIEERMGGTSHYQLMKNGIRLIAPVRHPGGFPGRGDFDSEYSYTFADFAVLYRTNAQAEAMEDAFRASGIPHQVLGGKYQSQRKGVTSSLSFLRALVNPAGDSYARKFSGRLPEGIDAAWVERFHGLQGMLPVDEFLKSIREDPIIREHCDGELFPLLEDLADQYRDMATGEALRRVFDELVLLTPADDFRQGAEAVTLMTMHMAKGLEFRVVFIAGVEDGLIPYTMKREDPNVEEERRLFYVGMTRAMDELVLICARNRFLYGGRLERVPSPFLKEIPVEFTDQKHIPERIRKLKRDDQMGLF
jgi:superfamily I DNA/RNA helicase